MLALKYKELNDVQLSSFRRMLKYKSNGRLIIVVYDNKKDAYSFFDLWWKSFKAFIESMNKGDYCENTGK